MPKNILLKVVSVIAFIVLSWQGFFLGAESSLVAEVIPSVMGNSFGSTMAYLSISISMAFLGFAFLLIAPRNLMIDFSQKDSIFIQSIKPLILGYVFGMAYISFVQLFIAVITLGIVP